MPVLHDYKCKECGHEFEHFGKVEDIPLCTECGSQTERIFKGSGRIHIFPEGLWDSIDPAGPIHIKNRKQLREECDKRELYSHYLD